MNELLNMLLEHLPRKPRSYDTSDDPGFWSDGDVILCSSEVECGIVADFLRDMLQNSTIVVKTSYFDPFEDSRNGECDDYTGFYYIDFENKG